MTCPHCGSGFDSKDKEAITYCSDFCHEKVFIPRTSLPRLPERWEGPFQADGKRIRCTYGDGYAYGECTIASCASEEEATFLAAMLNACYPASPTATEQK